MRIAMSVIVLVLFACPVYCQDNPPKDPAPVFRLEEPPKEPDWFARIVAGSALVVSLGAVALGLYNHWWDRKKWNAQQQEKEAEREEKEEARKERIKVELNVGASMPDGVRHQYDIRVKLLNLRSDPVPIKMVGLSIGHPDKSSSTLYEFFVQPTDFVAAQKVQRTCYLKDAEVFFARTNVDRAFLEQIIKTQPKDVFIMVASHKNVDLARINGDEIIKHVKDLLDLVDHHPAP